MYMFCSHCLLDCSRLFDCNSRYSRLTKDGKKSTRLEESFSGWQWHCLSLRPFCGGSFGKEAECSKVDLKPQLRVLQNTRSINYSVIRTLNKTEHGASECRTCLPESILKVIETQAIGQQLFKNGLRQCWLLTWGMRILRRKCHTACGGLLLSTSAEMASMGCGFAHFSSSWQMLDQTCNVVQRAVGKNMQSWPRCRSQGWTLRSHRPSLLYGIQAAWQYEIAHIY